MPSMHSKHFYVLQRLRRKFSNDVIRCPACSEELTTGRLSHHAVNFHALDPKTMCPYCVGRYRWKNGTKGADKNTLHLIGCIKKCRNKFGVKDEPSNDGPFEAGTSNPSNSSPESCKTCRNFKPQSRDLFGRRMDRTNEYLGLYEPLFEKPDEYEVEFELFDERRGLKNDLIGIVNRFLKGDLNWYHVMVKDDVYATFKEEMTKISNEIFILPYWCLCDGLKRRGSRRRVLHRHMILACIKESKFDDVWRYKVRYGSTDGSKCKYRVKIEDAFHLVNTLQYVSQRKSSCDGKVIRDELEENDFRCSHFYINNHLTDHAVAFLCTLFPDGLEKLGRQQNGRKNVVDWMDETVSWTDRNNHKKWGVAFKETGFKFLDCVIPLRRDLEPTEEETDTYLTWMRGRKMYLKENPELLSLSDEEWLEHQIRKGNTFRSIADEIYQYSGAQKNMTNQLRVMEERTKRKVSDQYQRGMNIKSIRHEREIKILKGEIKILKEENETFKRRITDTDDEIKTLKEENKNEIKTLKEENKNEIKTLKEENKRKIKTLKRKITDNEKDIKALKKENKALKIELMVDH